MITAWEKARLIAYMTGENVDKIRLYPASVTVDEKKLQEYVDRVEAGETVGRIIGRRWFWKDEFLINNTLEPRADSETVITAVLADNPDREQRLNILDIGTGSGCLILSLLREYPNARGHAIDKSQDALDTAKENAKNLQLASRCRFSRMDFTERLPDGDYDIIVANPPYIKSGDIDGLDARVKNFDPHIALDGGADGLDAYRAILARAASARIFFEIGQGQEDDVVAIAERYGYRLAGLHRDLSDIVRVVALLQ